MSFGIYWLPVKPEAGKQLPTGLKYALAERHMGSSSLRGSDAYFDKSHIGYLTGLVDAGGQEVQEGALELIKAIQEHGTVRVWIGEADD